MKPFPEYLGIERNNWFKKLFNLYPRLYDPSDDPLPTLLAEGNKIKQKYKTDANYYKRCSHCIYGVSIKQSRCILGGFNLDRYSICDEFKWRHKKDAKEWDKTLEYMKTDHYKEKIKKSEEEYKRWKEKD